MSTEKNIHTTKEFKIGGAKYSTKGMEFKKEFTNEKQTPFEMFKYDKRNSVIRNPDGSIVFEINDIEVPTTWSQVATDILTQKYIRKKGVPQYDEKGKLILDKNGKPVSGSEKS